ILGISKGILRVFSSDFPLLGAPPIPVLCSIILTLDFPLLEAEVALIGAALDWNFIHAFCEVTMEEKTSTWITDTINAKSYILLQLSTTIDSFWRCLSLEETHSA
ncbi:hypothetical protein L208DRAFT_1265835, partial [Tricholoma matsutake]